MVDQSGMAAVVAIESRLAREMHRWMSTKHGQVTVSLIDLAAVVHEIARDVARRELAERYQLLARHLRHSNTSGLPAAAATVLDRWADSIERRATALHHQDRDATTGERS